MVLMPTAMPELPLTSRLGIRAGRTVGSCRRSSKLGSQLTVSLAMSSRSWTAVLDRRASV